MQKRDLYYLYDSLYSGSSDSILREIDQDMMTNQDIVNICRYACDNYLRWQPADVIRNFTDVVIQKMKLEPIVARLKLPPEVSLPERYAYLCTLMYPEHFGGYKKEFFVIGLYRSVLTGARDEFPRCFLSGSWGADQNARICLMYALQSFAGLSTPQECVRFMASKRATPFLKEARLYYTMKRRYRDPMTFVSNALVTVGMFPYREIEEFYTGKSVIRKNVGAQAEDTGLGAVHA